MVDVNKVAENIYMIDDQLYSIPRYGSVYLINEEKKALIDTGPATSVNVVLDGIKKVGVKPEDVDYLIATHIHLDHAGGAGILLRDMPRARVVVHHRGARHLANPAKLMSSMIADRGEEAIKKDGEMIPIEPARIQSVNDGDTIKLSGGQVLKFIEAQGHAPHELCIHESRNNGIFTGDAAGLYISGVMIPGPNVEPELCINTLERLAGLNASILYFSHFGVTNKVQQILQLAVDKLQAWNEIVDKAIEDNMFDSAGERLVAQACAELEPIKKMKSMYSYLVDDLIPLSASFLVKYYQQKCEA